MRVLRVCRANARTGFTFLEVLFAVILLGIGFIMIAAIFPVAIAQNTATANEDQGILICRSGADMVQGIANNASLPPTGGIVTPVNNIGEGQFVSADHRYAWVAFYNREEPAGSIQNAALSPYAQVFIFALHNQTYTNLPNGQYGPSGVYNSPTTTVTASFLAATSSVPSYVTVNSTSAAEGAYLLVKQSDGGMVAGRILRLGASTGAANQFYLQPGMDLQNANEAVPNVSVYLVGAVPSTSTPLQDISLMSTFVRINQ